MLDFAAEKLYREERTKLDVSQIQARLNSTELASPAEITPVDTPPTTEPPTTEPTTNGHSSVVSEDVPVEVSNGNGDTVVEGNGDAGATVAVNDKSSDAGSDAGDLFGNLLDEMPKEEVNDLGTTVPVRDMALAKHYSGKTPRVNLEETVRKVDKYATVVFKVISRSRAVRASVSIRWDGGRTQNFEMQETACFDQAQAFNYIATVALFAVSQTAVNKQLPLVFRDLWDELVQKKKDEDDEAYREQLKLFKAIAEPRLQPPVSRVRLFALGRTLSALTSLSL